MTPKIKKWANYIFLTIVALTSIAYIFVCLVPFLDSPSFWIFSAIGLLFPLLLFLLLLFLFILLRRKSKLAYIILLVLLLGGKQVLVMFGFHFFKKDFDIIKNEETLRVMTWNVARWDEMNKKARGGESYRLLMMDAIRRQDADVLCLQEFFEPYLKRFQGNLQPLAAMGYSYQYFFPTTTIWGGDAKFGMVIASRLPIVDSGHTNFTKTLHSEGLMYADINKNGKIIRVYSVHLESSKLGRSSYLGPLEKEDVLGSSKMVYRSFKRAYTVRNAQARILSGQIKESPYPVVVCGNLGDIPNSNTYFEVSNGLQDVFLKKGLGMGATFRFFSPTLRIEYIFSSKKLKVLNYSRPKLPYSDHYPILADFAVQ